MEVPIDEIDQIDFDQMEDFSPEKLAGTLFQKEPGVPNSCQLRFTQDDDLDASYIFEILVTVLMEGLDIFSGGLDKVDLKDFSSEQVLNLNQWFRSIGYNITVKEYPIADREKYEEYYCKIVTRTSADEMLFQIRGINKNYTFNLNGDFLEANRSKELKNLFGLLKTNDKAYTVSFDFFFA